MFSRIKFPLVVSFAALFVSACATTPAGRKQVLLVGEGQMAEMGDASFNEL
ncbi:MAG TPA: Zn-dependent protease, partial [Bdellovibrionales bacterium]|nr:Zn-dependent protease [Bdellovibrionales bacterium]